MTEQPSPPNIPSLSSTSAASFPRTEILPKQSPKYWVKEKDRYLRQLLISDIQQETGRELVAYFTSQGMMQDPDSFDLLEVLNGCKTSNVDLMIQTPGGVVDACEQMISVLNHVVPGYRVVIPGMAKSAGTVLAISASEIIMGVSSELGPIDPQFNGIPAEYIRDDPQQLYPIRQMAGSAILRNQQLAEKVLTDGMMNGKLEADIKSLVEQLSSAQSYLSHGAVINAEEALALGLKVQFMKHDDKLWRKFWLLHCMYDYDCKQQGYSKIFEGAQISLAKPLPPSTP